MNRSEHLDALPYFSEVISREPDISDLHLRALSNRASIYMNTGEYKRAQQDLRRVLEIDPENETAGTQLKALESY